ncbi:MAG: IS4/IS5 family transposase, partial [Raineya sp.]|nr:IS4/IS5 family transposase [Raineya sp.]
IYEARKVKKLLFLLSLAFVWAYKTGVWLNETKPIRICKNEYREFSFFRYGLLYLQNCLLNNAQYQNIISTIKILSGD